MLAIGDRMRTALNYLVLLGAMTVALLAPNKTYADTIMLQGSTTFGAQILAPHQAKIELASGHRLNIITNKTTPGLIALLEGKADLAMVSTPLKSAIALARKTHPDLAYERLQSFFVTQTRVAIAVHASNPVRTIARESLRQVLRGKITNWRKLGGADLPIRLVMVRDGGGVKLTVEHALLGGDSVTAKDPILLSNGPRIVKVVEQEPGALGLAQLNLVKHFELPELALDHAVVQELNLVSLGDPTAAAKAVIDAIQHCVTAAID
jgi:ABC-type phosphate transport system substrate-binding protein